MSRWLCSLLNSCAGERSGFVIFAACLICFSEMFFPFFVQAADEVQLRGPLPAGAQSEEELQEAANADEMKIVKPSLNALISINRNIDPLMMDATSSTPVALPEIAQTVLRNNLDIGISSLQENARKASYYSQLGKFLPDLALSYQYQYLKGKANLPLGPTPDPIRFNNPLIITSAGFKYHVYRGGSILYGALRSRNEYRASGYARRSTTNDALLEAGKLYYDLVLQEAMLQVRIKAVETSQSQLQLSRNMKAAGVATKLDVLQAETQLTQDRQNLIDQQIARRDAAIRLAEYANLDQSVDLRPADFIVQKIRLVSEQALIGDYLRAAIDFRPELKQYEQLRLAAKKAIIVAQARLHPQVQFTGNVYGIGETLSDSYRTVLVQPQAVQPVPITSGGTVPATGVRRVNRQITGLFSLGLAVNWNFEGMGTVSLADTHSAKLNARQAQLEQQKILNKITAEVRRSYLRSLSTERKLEEAITQVRSATEELRLARLRYRNGIGKNIDVLRAQQDYTSALIEKARALVDFNIAQIQVLHDIGAVSVNTLTARAPLHP